MILATKPYFPPKEKYLSYIEEVYRTGWLTNNGVFAVDLEKKLKNYLKVDYLSVLTNGTVAIQMAIKTLSLKGEIITTPFSYVATTSSIVWENCEPIFVDIKPSDFTIDPNKIEAAITSKTTAILATHVFGYPCEVEKIEQIAKKHNLKIIYDAAHAFGVKVNGISVLNYGDISTLSFHATKLFHTVEGGAVIATKKEVADVLEYQRRFGHDGPYKFHGLGINAKLSEIHAAMGHCVLDDIDSILAKRKSQWLYYFEQLQNLNVHLLQVENQVKYNYAYFPIVFQSEDILLKILQALELKNIFPRRYFYPSLNTINYVKYQSMPISESIASKVMCLPLFHDLEVETQNIIINTICSSVK
jgi:dTDP-4-amino-4,6-dideoxygalactose transaminase